jgi:hypothetical protein
MQFKAQTSKPMQAAVSAAQFAFRLLKWLVKSASVEVSLHKSIIALPF